MDRRLTVTLTVPHLNTTDSPYRELSAIVRNLSRDSFRLVVCYLRGEGTEPTAEMIRDHGHECVKVRYRPRQTTAGEAVRATRETVRMHRTYRADIHHALDYSPVPFEAAMARALGRRFVFHQIDLSEDSRKRLLQTKVRLAHRVVALSDAVADHLVRVGGHRDRIRVIANGLDLEEFDTSAQRPPVAPVPHPYVLVASHVQSRKRQIDAVNAFAAMAQRRPDLHLLLAGATHYDAPYVEQVRHLTHTLELTDRVHLLGLRPDIPALLAGAQVSLLCSESDAFPWVLIESLASGTPTITTDTVGGRAIVRHDETGRIVPVGDTAAIAAAVDEALDRPPAVVERTRAGRRDVEARFSSTRMVHELTHVYDELLTPTRPRPH